MSARYKQQATPASHYHIKNKLIAGYDLWLMGVALLIIFTGLVMMTSASISISAREFNDPLHYFWRQGFAAVIGLSFALIALKIPMRLWEMGSMSLLILAVCMLC